MNNDQPVHPAAKQGVDIGEKSLLNKITNSLMLHDAASAFAKGINNSYNGFEAGVKWVIEYLQESGERIAHSSPLSKEGAQQEGGIPVIEYCTLMFGEETEQNKRDWDIATAAFLAGTISIASSSPSIEAEEEEKSFQTKVFEWCIACFGEKITSDIEERNHRFIEESLELVQSTGCSKSECLQLVDYVFSRPTGETKQEIGGVIVTLAALCNALGESISENGDTELKRVWAKIDKIREKQAAKPKHSAMPSSSPASNDGAEAYWDDIEDIFDKHTSPTGGGYEADYTDKRAFISELKSKYFLSLK